jgi:predicted transcriptional regulator
MLNAVNAFVGRTMKTPCELVVWYVLPMIRRGLADELIDHHGFRQTDVAKLFGITDSAVSAYRSRGRKGDFNQRVVKTKQYFDLKYEFVGGAARIANGIKVRTVVCEICTNIRKSGLLDLIHELVTGESSNCRYANQFVIIKEQ